MNPRPTVLVMSDPGAYFLRMLQPIHHEAEFVISGDVSDLEQSAPRASAALAVGLPGSPIRIRELWPALPKLEWIHSLSAGVENLLFPELVHSRVVITNARGIYKRSLAEFVMLAVLYFFKSARRLVEQQRQGRWEQFLVRSLPGATLGIVGYGEIGRECATLAHRLGMRVLAVRRRPAQSQDDEFLSEIYPLEELNRMLGKCDVVTTVLPLTAHTRGLFGRSQFASMRKSAIFVNIGRGATVDEAALIDALRSRQIEGAALDVFEQEPLPAGHPFYSMENVLLSPHCTDRTDKPDWLDLSMQRFVDNFRLFRAGRPLDYVVDKEAGY